MNRRRQNIPSTEGGSALLAALCFCAVLGIALASYMSVCSQTLQLSNRNSQGTHSLELAETGMEEALWALNKTDWSTWTHDDASAPRIARKTLDGFSFGNGVTGTITLTVENYDGLSPSPVYKDGLRKLTVAGSTLLADGTSVTRTLQASAQRAPLFVNAIASISPTVGYGISFASWGLVDSFDSSRFGAEGDLDGDGIANKDDVDMDGDGKDNIDDDDIDGDGILNSHDSTELYGSMGFSAVVSSATSIDLANAEINGYVAAATVPRSLMGVRVAGPNASTSFTGIDPTRFSTSPYQPTFEIKTPALQINHTELSPSSLSIPPVGSPPSIGNPAINAATQYYYADDIILSDGQKLTVNGPVVIEVRRNFKIQGSGQVVVTLTGSLQVFLVGGANELSIGGQGIQNLTKRPKNVAIFDAAVSAATNPEISTPADFYGVVYAPKSDRELVVSSNLNFYGSLVAKTVSILGLPSIHYDVDLRRVPTKFNDIGIETPFVISAWQEITP